jgi:uncharacterized protein YdeI (YjbR/CyaY-like superfamily)
LYTAGANQERKVIATEKINPKVDAYLGKVQTFALPIMEHLRELVHRGCPGVEETIKWSRPFFEYRGVILCNMSAFKEHCSFGFWGEEIGAVLRDAKVVGEEGMGSLGRITSLKDLPSDKQMLGWIRQAAAFVDNGEYTSPIAARHKVVKPERPSVEAPAEFSSALNRNKKAAAMFRSFSPSCKREYLEWIADAKRPETREKRIATAIDWIADGKQRNWKYQNC